MYSILPRPRVEVEAVAASSPNLFKRRTDVKRPVHRRAGHKPDFANVRRQLTKLLFTVPQALLGPLALRNVDESHHRADHISTPVHGMRPVFARKAGAVATPDDFVVDVCAKSVPESPVDMALLRRIRHSIGAGVVHHGVHVLAQQLARLLVTQNSHARWTTKCAKALNIDTVNGLGNRIQNQTYQFATLSYLLLGPLALADIAREGEKIFLPIELHVVGRDFDRENPALLGSLLALK